MMMSMVHLISAPLVSGTDILYIYDIHSIHASAPLVKRDFQGKKKYRPTAGAPAGGVTFPTWEK